MVVQDNAPIHTSVILRTARQGLVRLGIFLPPYSPESNRIEPVKLPDVSRSGLANKAACVRRLRRGSALTVGVSRWQATTNHGKPRGRQVSH